jgi:hypothetical protein
VLSRQGLEQRGLHDPVEGAQAEHVPGEKVVLNEAGVFGLILRDDREVVVVQQWAALCRPPLVQVERAALPEHVPGHTQPDRAVDRPATPGDLGVGVLGFDLVAEEARRLAGGVGDQRLGLRQPQLPLLTQERGDPRLDLLGLVLGPANPSSQSSASRT